MKHIGILLAGAGLVATAAAWAQQGPPPGMPMQPGIPTNAMPLPGQA